MKTKDKATYLSYVLGKAMLKALDVAVHELKMSGDKEDAKHIQITTKDRVRLHQTFNKLFTNAAKYLKENEQEELDEAVNNLLASIWIDDSN